MFRLVPLSRVVCSLVRQLATCVQSQRAWIQSKTTTDQLGEEWTIDVQLRIGGGGISLFGDGAALWLTKEPFTEGEVFAREPTWTGLGLFLDTYDNAPGKHVHKHPYVSAFVSGGDHKFSYSELEADDKSLEDPAHAASRAHAGCHARLRQYGRDPKIVTVRLSYTRSVRKLVVRLFLGRRRDQYRSAADYAWQQCFALHSVDIPPGYWLAASASTGQLTDTHEVLSIESQAKSPAELAGHLKIGPGSTDSLPLPLDGVMPPPPPPDAVQQTEATSQPQAQIDQSKVAWARTGMDDLVSPALRAERARRAAAEQEAAAASRALDAIKGDVSAFKREVRLALQGAQDSYAKHEDVAALQRSSSAAADSVKAQLVGKAATSDVQRVQRHVEQAVSTLEARVGKLEQAAKQAPQPGAGAPTWLAVVALLALLGCAALGVMVMRLQHRMRKMHLP